jgi:hypothetical protein
MSIAGLPGFTESPFRSDPGVIIKDIEVEIGPVEEKQLEALIVHITRDIQAQMIRSFREPKHGRLYRRQQIIRRPGGGPFSFTVAPQRRGRPGETRTYRASAPNEAPAIQAGWLLEEVSLGYTKVSPTEAEIFIPMDYANWLELGVGRIEPRPFVVPAINEVLSKLKASDVLESFDRVSRADIAA